MSKKNRKWLVFTIMCLAYMPGSYAQYQLSVYASELIQSFGLTTSQFSSLFTAPMIVAIFLSFVGGMISDKVGSKKVINISFVIAGIGMIGRVFANSYMPFFLCMALTGFSNMFVNINASKITASWFEQEKLGILMGIFGFCGQLPGAFARKLGLQAYNMFNHTEAGFPNINLHYPLPWLETSEKMTEYMRTVPQLSMFNLNRRLLGSVGDDLQARFVTPYDVGWDFLIKYNHDFIGKEALLEMSKKPQKKCVTLEWNAEDVAEVFATMLSPGEEPCEDITKPCALEYYFCVREFGFEYRADKVLAADKEIGITSGKIISYTYNSMISLAFISAEYAKEGTELEILWGTPGTRQMKVRAKVARFPYNQDYIRNEKRDVSDIPVFER